MPIDANDPKLDYGGSWDEASKTWPYIRFKTEKDAQNAFVVAHRVIKIPYGSYVIVGCDLRLETEEYITKVRKHLILSFNQHSFCPECDDNVAGPGKDKLYRCNSCRWIGTTPVTRRTIDSEIDIIECSESVEITFARTVLALSRYNESDCKQNLTRLAHVVIKQYEIITDAKKLAKLLTDAVVETGYNFTPRVAELVARILQAT